MNVQKIVADWLKAHGYDGLLSETGACACRLADLMPCEEPGVDCLAGHEEPCPGEPTDYCEGDCTFHIIEGPGKGTNP